MITTQYWASWAAWLFGAIMVRLITLAFRVTAALLLRATWLNFNQFLLDFIKTCRLYMAANINYYWMMSHVHLARQMLAELPNDKPGLLPKTL